MLSSRLHARNTCPCGRRPASDAHGVESGVMNLLEIFGFETRLGRIGQPDPWQDVDPAHLATCAKASTPKKHWRTPPPAHSRRSESRRSRYGECGNQQTSKRAKRDAVACSWITPERGGSSCRFRFFCSKGDNAYNSSQSRRDPLAIPLKRTSELSLRLPGIHHRDARSPSPLGNKAPAGNGRSCEQRSVHQPVSGAFPPSAFSMTVLSLRWRTAAAPLCRGRNGD